MQQLRGDGEKLYHKWSFAETALLLHCVKIYGQDWKLIRLLYFPTFSVQMLSSKFTTSHVWMDEVFPFVCTLLINEDFTKLAQISTKDLKDVYSILIIMRNRLLARNNE